MKQLSADRLRQTITHQSDDLLRILRQYVLRFGLAVSPHHEGAASELLSDVTIQVLNHTHQMPDDAEPFAWLLGIALNLIKRRLSKMARWQQREPLIQDLYPAIDLTESEIIDQFIHASSPPDYESVDQHDMVEDLLSKASREDALLLRLALKHNFDGQAIAGDLGISPGAARVRLHRALKRQRQRLGIRQNEPAS